MTDESMTIASVANAAGVGVETVRYYERRRLIAQPASKRGVYRRYDGSHVAVYALSSVPRNSASHSRRSKIFSGCMTASLHECETRSRAPHCPIIDAVATAAEM